jgi:hypothetical protein
MSPKSPYHFPITRQAIITITAASARPAGF